jgi:hypothetical protein
MAQLVGALRFAGSIPDGVTGIFQWQSFRSHYDPGVDSASDRNEYQEYFLGGKGGQCVQLTTILMCRVSWNLGASTSWNPQGLSRPVMGLLYLIFYCPFSDIIIQGDQKVTVHLMITVQKTRKNILNSFNHHDNVARIRDIRWRYCESRVPLALAVSCQAVRLSQVVRQERLSVL